MNEKNGPVLVAVDFSDDSVAALLWASDYADAVKAPLSVVHVVHDPGDAPGYYPRSEQDLLRPMEDLAKQMLDEFLDKIRGDHPSAKALQKIKTILVRGTPAMRIVEVAKLVGARLLVIGSRGRTGLPHFLLGSKSERVVQLSPIPVTVVKTPEGDES